MTRRMQNVKITISRYVDDSFPGVVECRLIDALGREHVFVEKLPIVTVADVDAASSYPQPGVIRCVVLGAAETDDGRRLVHIDTAEPDGVESSAGVSRFDVLPEQLVGFDPEGDQDEF